MKKNHTPQDYIRWNLPEGAKARLGKGWINEIAYSPDGSLLAVGCSIGIWLYDRGTGQELNLLTKHKSDVTSVAFSPDGSTIASATRWGEICLWNVSDGVVRPLHHYQSDWLKMSSIAFSPDGTTLAIGSGDFAIYLWNVETGTHIKTFLPPPGEPRSSVLSVAFSGDSQMIASGNFGEINLWCPKTYSRKAIIKPPPDSPDSHESFESIAFSPDGTIFVTGSRFSGLMGSRNKEGAVRLWNAKTGTYLKTLDGHTLSINSIAFAINNNIFASGSMDGTIRLWNAKTGTCLKTITGDTSSVESVAFSPDGTTVASAYSSGKVRQWNVKTGTCLKIITGHTSRVNSVTFSPDGTTVASGHHRGKIQLWDAMTGKPFKTITGHTSSVKSIAFSSNSHLMVSAGDDQMVYVWNAETGELRYSLTGLTESSIGSTSDSVSGTFSPNSRLLVTRRSSSYCNATHVWNAQTGELRYSLTEQTESMVFSPNSRLIVSGADGMVRVWDAQTGELKHTFTEHTRSDSFFRSLICSVVFSPDSRLIVSGGTDGMMRVWDAQTGELKHTFTEHTRSDPFFGGSLNSVKSVAFSDDNCFIASGDSDGIVRVWNAQTGELKHTFTEHGNKIESVTFSPNSRLIVSGSTDGTVCVWNVQTGELKHTFTEHKGLVENVSFRPDGRTLATGSQDGTVLLWDLDFVPNKTIFAEKNTEFLNRQSRIQQICQRRGITTLVHFTRIENLRNILHEGLLDHQSLLKRPGQQFVPNDRKRRDGHKEAICLSISFPNYQLFSKFSWSDNESQPGYSGWIVLLLDAKVLWELDCAFCQENAASNAVRYISLEERKKPNALKGLFVDVCRDTKGNIYQRQSLQIPDDYPTHPQAEVLVFEQIQSDYIKEIHFLRCVRFETVAQ